MLGYESILVSLAIALLGVFALLWVVRLVLDRDVEQATRNSAQGAGSVIVGGSTAFAVLVGELGGILGDLLNIIASAPEVVVAAIGYRAIVRGVDPWMFVAMAGIAILSAVAIRRG